MGKALLLLLGLSFAAQAHDVFSTKITWSREISRLMYKHCASCHHDGGTAMPLMNFEESRPWAKAIKDEVLARRMPPWGAVKGFGEFKNDQGLTQEEIEIIGNWVEGGAPEGEPAYLPPAPTFPNKLAKPTMVPTVIADLSGTFTLRVPLTLTGVQPGNIGDGVGVQIIAERPDGSVEPILWLDEYKNVFPHTFEFRMPLVLPAGTKLIASPAVRGTLELFAVRAKVKAAD